MAHRTDPAGYRRALASLIGRASSKNKKNYGRPSYGRRGANAPRVRAYSHDYVTRVMNGMKKKP